MAAPTVVSGSYAGVGIAPHALTTRTTYTVPAGRFTIIESALAQVTRDGAAGAAGFVAGIIAVDGVRIINVAHLGAAVDARQGAHSAGQIRCPAGAVVTTQTVDLATGGTNAYAVYWRGIEYDV